MQSSARTLHALQKALLVSKSSNFHAQTARSLCSSLPRKQLRFQRPSSPFASTRSYSLFAGDSEPATQSQEALARLESEANASPEDVDKQIKLFRELVVSGAERAVVSRWETAVQTVSLPLASQYRIKLTFSHHLQNPKSPLLSSEEAFSLYLLSLSRTGQARHIAEAVRQRDALLGTSTAAVGVPLAAHASTSDSAASSTIAASSAASSDTNGIWNNLVSRIRGRGEGAQEQQAATSKAGSDMVTISALDEIGARARPVHVVVEESRQLNGGRVVRSLLTTAFYAFCFLTIASLVLENSGLMKVGQQPTEFEPEDGKIVKFSDVHGVDEAKSELEEVVEFLRHPEKFSNLGGKLPKGVLLTGPPGTGKTMLARAVAGEAGVPFFFASGSSFDEVYVGVGQRRIRELFALARKRSPAIIFIDELDAVGSKRAGREAQHMRQTLNQLLVELDGFEESEGIIVIA